LHCLIVIAGLECIHGRHGLFVHPLTRLHCRLDARHHRVCEIRLTLLMEIGQLRWTILALEFGLIRDADGGEASEVQNELIRACILLTTSSTLRLLLLRWQPREEGVSDVHVALRTETGIVTHEITTATDVRVISVTLHCVTTV
jgi:hypothetical protein